jgi:hypothetical protein
VSHDGVGVGLVGLDDIGAFDHARVEPGRVAGQDRGADARLQEQLDDPRPDVPGRRGDDDLHGHLT